MATGRAVPAPAKTLGIDGQFLPPFWRHTPDRLKGTRSIYARNYVEVNIFQVVSTGRFFLI
jgi:hypothetical protein